MDLRAALLVLLSSPAIARADCRAVEISGQGALTLRDQETSRLLVTDAGGVHRPRWSPDGSLVAYHTRFGNEARVAVVDVESGSIRTQIRVTPVQHSVNTIDQLGWRASGHVWLEGHVNPSVSAYVELDAKSGDIRRIIPGLGFSVSPDGERLAHFSHVPHSAPEEERTRRFLIVDDREFVTVSGDLRGPIVWSRDGTTVTFRNGSDLVQVNVRTGEARALVRPVQSVVARERALTSDVWCSPE